MPSVPFRFDAPQLPPDAEGLRAEVRRFVAKHRSSWSMQTVAESWVCFDRAFSREVGRQGWIGMTWPREYGGGGRTALERFIVLEEMLAVGAPIGAHSTGDRQTGPLLLRIGTEEQKHRFLPQLARGEISVCVGMSEPDAGSDLSAIRARATRTEKGWRLDGRKIWTTNAHVSEYMLGLFRTGEAAGDRRGGLSQFLIDLSLPGIEIRGIKDMSGRAHFNEVTFDGAELPLDAIVGEEGRGWQQVTAELAFERSGPDRYMSAFPLLGGIAHLASWSPDSLALQGLGAAFMDVIVLREMTLSNIAALARGETPSSEVAMCKELGVSFEQSVPELARRVLPAELRESDPDYLALEHATALLAPTYSLRGGTREIMQGIIARGLGLR